MNKWLYVLQLRTQSSFRKVNCEKTCYKTIAQAMDFSSFLKKIPSYLICPKMLLSSNFVRIGVLNAWNYFIAPYQTTVARWIWHAITKMSFQNQHLPSLNQYPPMCWPSLKRPQWSLRQPLTTSSLKRASKWSLKRHLTSCWPPYPIVYFGQS